MHRQLHLTPLPSSQTTKLYRQPVVPADCPLVHSQTVGLSTIKLSVCPLSASPLSDYRPVRYQTVGLSDCRPVRCQIVGLSAVRLSACPLSDCRPVRLSACPLSDCRPVRCQIVGLSAVRLCQQLCGTGGWKSQAVGRREERVWSAVSGQRRTAALHYSGSAPPNSLCPRLALCRISQWSGSHHPRGVVVNANRQVSN